MRGKMLNGSPGDDTDFCEFPFLYSSKSKPMKLKNKQIII